MLKFLIIISFLFGPIAHADNLTCRLQEKLSGQETIRELPLGSFKSGFGNGTLRLENDQLTVSLTDPRWKKPVTAQLSALPGNFARMQLIPNERTNDYLILECERAGFSETKKSLSAICSLIETAGSQQLQTSFEVPLAQNGHDYQELPAAKLAPITGWVMLYNDMLITSIQNKDTMTGLSGMGSSDQGTSFSWYPSAQNIKVTVSCQPLY